MPSRKEQQALTSTNHKPPTYRMPAEWAPHAATWIAWPHNSDDWPGKFQTIPWVYCEIVRHLSRVEDVHILVNNTDAERRATGLLRRDRITGGPCASQYSGRRRATSS